VESRRRRLAVLLLVAAACGAGALAWPWLQASVVTPLALLAWLLLRLFVLSVDQQVWWLAATFAVPALLVLALRRPPGPGLVEEAGPQAPVHPLESWRRLLEQEARGVRERRLMGWDGLAQLLVSLVALERRVPADYLVHEALRSGRLPLPPAVHAFAFPPAPARPARWPGRLLSRLRAAPRRALRRLTGRELQERRQGIAAVLAYLEDSLELTPHDDPSRPPRT
jgi:hypothetical protein